MNSDLDPKRQWERGEVMLFWTVSPDRTIAGPYLDRPDVPKSWTIYGFRPDHLRFPIPGGPHDPQAQ